jgi:hypothetical protein
MTTIKLLNEDGVIKGVDTETGEEVPVEFDDLAASSMDTEQSQYRKRDSELADEAVGSDDIAVYARQDNMLRTKADGTDEMAVGTGMRRVDSGTVSSATEIDFTVSDTFARYVIQLDDLNVSAGTLPQLAGVVSDDGGDTYYSNDYNAQRVDLHDLGNSPKGAGGSEFRITDELSGGRGASQHTITVSYPGDGKEFTQFKSSSVATGPGGSNVRSEFYGRFNTQQSIDTIRIRTTEGDFDGIYRLYGVA